MKALVSWAGANRAIALLITAMVVACGVWAVTSLPIDAVPDVTNIQVQIVTRAPALSATEVEQQVTQPIEREMAGTPHLVTMRSITKLGISVITLIFDDSIDVYFARTLVSERMQNVREKIPEDVGRPELGPISTALGEIYMFELKDRTGRRSGEELRTIADWQIGPRLRQVPGVIEVVSFGGAAKQYRVTLDPGRMAAHGIAPREVREALERDNRVAGGGYIDDAGEQVVLRGDARFRGIEDIAATVVRTDPRGIPVTVGELGEVDTGPALRQGAMTRDGRGEVAGASVFLLKGANTRDVVEDVKHALADLAPYLPEGVSIEPYYDRADFINRVLKTIARNLSEGAIIVVGCLLLTLGSIRAGLLVAGTIPFAMLCGFLGLHLLGYSGNVMSLGAIDFGIIVEGVVLAVEHAMTHSAGLKGAKRRHAIMHAVQDSARPGLFVVAITLLVFLPLATLEDVEGKMFRPVVFSLCFMLVGAIFYALIIIPAVAPVVLTGKGGGADPPFARGARRAYAPLLGGALRRPWLTMAGAFALAGALLFFAGSKLGADFLPRIFEGALAIDTIRPPSTSLPQAIALSDQAERALKEVPEVETVVSRIGRPEGAVDPAGPESSDVFVILKPRDQWRKGLTPETLVEELSDRVYKNVPATIHAFSQPIEMRVNDLIAGVKSDVAIKLYGDDLTTLYEQAERIKRTLQAIPGASDFRAEIPFGLPSVTVKVDRAKIARLGVPPGDVLDVLTMSRAGLDVGLVREGERVFDLKLRMGGDEIDTAAEIGRLPITTSQGALVPLSMAADVQEDRTVVQISREQMKRRLIVQGNVRGRDMVGFVREAQQAIKDLNLPKSVEITWGGQFQNFTRAKERLTLLVPVALGVIAMLLTIMFKSLKLMMATVLSLPFALAGGVFALFLRDLPFSIPAAVGFIAVSGVSVCTGTVLTNALLAEPKEKSPRDRVRDSAVASLRAPLSTALVAAIGFIPAAISTGAGAEVQRPLATVVIGGLIASMLLTLFALPAMLLKIAEYEQRAEKKRSAKAKAEDDDEEEPSDAAGANGTHPDPRDHGSHASPA